MTKSKELIICIISIIALVLVITTTVFASDADSLNEMLGNNPVNNSFETIPEKTTNNTTNNTTGNINSATNNTNNTANTIPYTGVDYSLILIIAVCGISAVYAYKKIREYNV